MNLINKSGFKGLFIQGFLDLLVIASFIAASLPSYVEPAPPALKQPSITVKSGETRIVSETTSLSELIIGDGAKIIASDGHNLTLTVDGVETGQRLVTTAGTDTQVSPGSYHGDIVLTVTENNLMPYQNVTFPLRQALYLDETGVVGPKSVFAALAGNKPSGFDINNIRIKSTGECFNGIYVAGGNYLLKDVKISLTGNGRNDFAGQGAAIVAIGNKTRLVVDGADINNKGVVRTAVIASGGSNVIVKNSTLKAMDGVLPADYVGNADITQMRGGFPIGGSLGNCRATNLLGVNTQATYINSSVSAEGWGVLSTDGCTTPKLTAINSRISITGNIGGYGTYAIGNATERFLGCEFKVAFDVTTLKGGYLFYGDSTPEAVAQLNKDLNLGLTEKELKVIKKKNTVISSERFGIMSTGDGTVDISGGTAFSTGETIFLNKGATVAITVDGSKGAQLNPGNGVIMQLMDPDDPGPTGKPYIEPATAPEKIASWDVTSSANSATGIFSNIKLKGNFYNSIGWTKAAATGGPGAAPGSPGGAPGAPDAAIPGGVPPGGSTAIPPAGAGGMPPGSMPGSGGQSGKNMALTFNNASITGVISASEAHHLKSVLYVNKEDYKLFGVVNNTTHAALNNGVIVLLTNNSNWTVTGTSYTTSLTIEAGSTITAPDGYNVTMTVDGMEKTIGAGQYKGLIMLTVTKNKR